MVITLTIKQAGYCISKHWKDLQPKVAQEMLSVLAKTPPEQELLLIRERTVCHNLRDGKAHTYTWWACVQKQNNQYKINNNKFNKKCWSDYNYYIDYIISI